MIQKHFIGLNNFTTIANQYIKGNNTLYTNEVDYILGENILI